MIERVLNRYTFIFFLMLFLHVVTVTVSGIFSYFDFVLIIFILTMGWGDEHNFVWLSVLYGFMLDFTRDGFYGPGVVLFIIFYLVRFRTDVIMDMTKVHYRVLLFSSMSMVYCMYNLFLTSYTLESALPVAIYRSVVNISIVFIISSFFKGYSIAVKNS